MSKGCRCLCSWTLVSAEVEKPRRMPLPRRTLPKISSALSYLEVFGFRRANHSKNAPGKHQPDTPSSDDWFNRSYVGRAHVIQQNRFKQADERTESFRHIVYGRCVQQGAPRSEGTDAA